MRKISPFGRLKIVLARNTTDARCSSALRALNECLGGRDVVYHIASILSLRPDLDNQLWLHT